MAVQIHAVCASNGVISAATLILSSLISLFGVKANSSFTKRMFKFGELC